MAVCGTCHREMTLGVPCSDPEYLIDGEVYARIPNGGDRCHDCAAPPGALHHPGCDDERCPVCKGQAISCGCGEPADDSDWV